MENQDPINKDLQEIIDVVADGVKTGIETLKDGFQYMDIAAFIPVLSKIPAAVTDAGNALHYLKDMTEEKETTIVNAVAEKLNDASDNVKEGARRILRAMAEVYMTIMFFANLKPSTPEPRAGQTGAGQ